MEYEVTFEVNAPAADVWTMLSDVEHWPDWTPTVTTVTRLDGGPLAVGSRARIKQPKLGSVVWTVTDMQPGRGFAWEARTGGAVTVGEHWLASSDGQPIGVTLAIRQSGPMAWLASLLYGGLTRRYVDTEARRLTQFCEAKCGGGSPSNV